ncbi:Mov34/MPN/PAD-1 family protein [Methanosarcina sp. KYL-1]|uniref:Mov34/MPN/PAD-1 family protein n=1 Tax=Methanosarcina sp. KYL-1 TaxID=2602068 RepID=UPI0021008B3E|nr:Mov34/MPN/PAD-1 family protein [Methanosarcina sp. KYL-1]
MHLKKKREDHIIFSKRAFTDILLETKERISTETGGLFIGKKINNYWIVLETIDPGPKSFFSQAYFEYDHEYQTHLANKIARRYGGSLVILGLWHRHPDSFNDFSGTDLATFSNFIKISPEGIISALVNMMPDFKFTLYFFEANNQYRKINYEIMEHELLLSKFNIKEFTLKEVLETINGNNKTINENYAARTIDVNLSFFPTKCTERSNNGLLVQKHSLWYQDFPELLKYEKRLMERLFPQFELETLPDGKMMWLGTVKSPKKNNWLLAIIYQDFYPQKENGEHPIRGYIVNSEKIISTDNIPYLRKDDNGEFYIQQDVKNVKENNFSVSQNAVNSLSFAINWIKSYESWTEKEITLDEFESLYCDHSKRSGI